MVMFIFLQWRREETDNSIGGDSAQYRFVIQDLANAYNNKCIGWIIVYGYSHSTLHQLDAGDTKVHRIYHPLLDQYR